jgi:hypothetical protein
MLRLKGGLLRTLLILRSPTLLRIYFRVLLTPHESLRTGEGERGRADWCSGNWTFWDSLGGQKTFFHARQNKINEPHNFFPFRVFFFSLNETISGTIYERACIRRKKQGCNKSGGVVMPFGKDTGTFLLVGNGARPEGRDHAKCNK